LKSSDKNHSKNQLAEISKVIPFNLGKRTFWLSLLLLVIFLGNFFAYIAYRKGISDDIYGGDTVNISLFQQSSLSIRRANIVNAQDFFFDLAAHAHDSPSENPYAFVYTQLSDKGRSALHGLIDDPGDRRAESSFFLDLNQNLIDRPIDWPNTFKGEPRFFESDTFETGWRANNLRAMSTIFPLSMPMPQLAASLKRGGDAAFQTSLDSLHWVFTLRSPTRYAPLTGVYVIFMQSLFMANGSADVPLLVMGFLYALLSVLYFLVGLEVFKSFRWALIATLMTQLCISSLISIHQLFSLPYILVPICITAMSWCYLKYRATGHWAWLIGFAFWGLCGPWFREFAAVVPFIVIASEFVSPSPKNRILLILCIALIVHGVYPSLLPWLVGLNTGIVVSILEQGNTQHQWNAAMLNYHYIILLLLQLPPLTWLLVFVAICGWVQSVQKERLSLSFFSRRWDLDTQALTASLKARKGLILKISVLLIVAAGIAILLWYGVHGTLNLITIENFLRPHLFFLIGGRVFLFLLGVFVLVSFRFQAFYPIVFSALFLPFLFINLAEMHLNFVVFPLCVLVALWLRTLWQKRVEWLPLRRNLFYLILVLIGGDHALNLPAAYTVQKELVAVNSQMGRWIADHLPRHSVIISNFYHYTDVFLASGRFFEPYETVENNPMGPTRTLHTATQTKTFLDREFPLRNIYFLAASHDFMTSGQRLYHSHKWAQHPPGKLEKLVDFSAQRTYPYLDPVKLLVPRFLVSLPAYMDWATDFYFGAGKRPFTREVNADYTLYHLTTYTGIPNDP